MLARGLLSRLAAGAPRASTRARVLQRSLLPANAAAAPAVRACPRAYATASASARATKPSRTVVTAVKKTAAKKTPAQKTPAKKAAKKPAKKPRKAAEKAKPGRRPRIELTAEQKLKAHVKKLRQTALTEPCSPHPLSAWNAYIVENKGALAAGKQESEKFKALTPAEREHYNHVASELSAAKRKVYDEWLSRHTVEEISAANTARNRLRRLAKASGKPHPSYARRIHDGRRVKRPLSAYMLFVKDRHASADFKGIAGHDSVKLISQEWNALSASEKQKYVDESLVLQKEHRQQQAEAQKQ